MYIQESYDYMSNLPPTDLLIKNNNEYKLEILWAMLTKWYPPLPHVLYGKVLVLLWETPKSFE